MSLEEDLDLTDYTDDEFDVVDKPVRVPNGWYRATIESWEDSTKFPGTHNIVFAIADGPYVGKKVFETLWDPQSSVDTIKADESRKRRISFAKRLGLVSRKDVGNTATVDWHAAVGMDVIIQVVQRTGKDGTERAQLTYMGIYPATDSRGIAHLEGGATPAEDAPTAPSSPSRAPVAPSHPPRPTKGRPAARAPIDYSALGDIPL